MVGFEDPKGGLNTAEEAKSQVKQLIIAKMATVLPSKKLVGVQGSTIEVGQSETTTSKNGESKAIIELQRYLEEPYIPLNADPIQWWYENRYNYPMMSEIAEEKMCITARSVPCEQLFSKAGLFISERRSISPNSKDSF